MSTSLRLFESGRIYTMSPDGVTDALAVVDGVIVGLGADAHRLAEGASHVERTTLGNRVVVPGFVDAHHHLGAAALYRGAVDCGPAVVRSVPAFLETLARAATHVPSNRWVLGFNYDEWALEEGRAPTRQELDAACPEHPALVMHFSFHQGVANSRALELAGIGRTTREPAAGRIERDRKGEPTGRLYEMAVSGLERLASQDLLARDPEGFLARLEQYQQHLFSLGITRVADPTVTTDLERLYRLAHAAGRLRMPVLMMRVSDGGYFAHPRDVIAREDHRMDGPPTGEGDERLRVGPLKLFFDGGDNCAMCLTLAQTMRAAAGSVARMARARSLRDALLPIRYTSHVRRHIGRDLRLHTGLCYYPGDEAATHMARAATDRGFALAIHAMGNEAVDQALRVLESLGSSSIGRPRIEHAMVVDRALIDRLAGGGVTVVSQPSFLRVPGVEFLPPLHGMRVLAHRSMLESGVAVAASSDAPVGPASPLLGLADAVHRTRPSGLALDADEAVDPLAALGMYTREAAAACGWGDVAGVLSTGRRAELVVLSSDPMQTPLDGIEVVETVLGRETVYRRARTTQDR